MDVIIKKDNPRATITRQSLRITLSQTYSRMALRFALIDSKHRGPIHIWVNSRLLHTSMKHPSINLIAVCKPDTLDWFPCNADVLEVRFTNVFDMPIPIDDHTLWSAIISVD